MELSRRSFIKASGATLMLLLNGVSLATVFESKTKNTIVDKDSRVAIEKSIKANFGSDFRIVSQMRRDNQIFVEIEHLGNYYSVVSANLIDWKILSSSI